jgi:FKBP-type peptidyl-prolyl cis-trans isomerase 2
MVSQRRFLFLVSQVFTIGLALLFLPAGACPEGNAIRPGDRVGVHFTCKFRNGDVAVSSYESVADDPGVRKSPVFVRRKSGEPVRLTARTPGGAGDTGEERGFEDEVLFRLSGAITGLKPGERQTREISAERRPENRPGDYFLRVARVRQRQKEMRLTPEDYKLRTGRAPEKGQPFTIDPAVPGKVSSVTEKEAVITFTAVPGSKVATAFGEATIKESANQYQIVIDAQAGNLVRNTGYVGRIVGVDENFISIDYGHPFGGDPLLCDIQVVEQQGPGVR